MQIDYKFLGKILDTKDKVVQSKRFAKKEQKKEKEKQKEKMRFDLRINRIAISFLNKAKVKLMEKSRKGEKLEWNYDKKNTYYSYELDRALKLLYTMCAELEIKFEYYFHDEELHLKFEIDEVKAKQYIYLP